MSQVGNKSVHSNPLPFSRKHCSIPLVACNIVNNASTLPIRLRVLFIGLVLLLIWMGQKFGPCNAQLSGKTRIPRNSALTTAITTTCSIIGLDLPKNSQVQLSGLLRRYLSGWLCHSSVLPASFSTIFTIKWYVCFTFFLKISN